MPESREAGEAIIKMVVGHGFFPDDRGLLALARLGLAVAFPSEEDVQRMVRAAFKVATDPDTPGPQLPVDTKADFEAVVECTMLMVRAALAALQEGTKP